MEKLLPDGPPPPFPPDAPVVITGASIIFEEEFNLLISLTIAGIPIDQKALVALSPDGSELNITTESGNESTIPFKVLNGLAEPPEFVTIPGDAEHEPVMALLANLDLITNPQSEDPGDFIDRGDAANAQSFLPLGQHIAIGVGKETYERFANNLWHTDLRADDDGSHPLPSADDRQGHWNRVRMLPENGRIRVILEGVRPIDILPDADITITVLITPSVSAEGKLNFTMDFDTDVDMVCWEMFLHLLPGALLVL
ncbi:MAG: hypothetical protein WDO16_23450 [Bacteroidota bacterium]